MKKRKFDDGGYVGLDMQPITNTSIVENTGIKTPGANLDEGNAPYSEKPVSTTALPKGFVRSGESPTGMVREPGANAAKMMMQKRNEALANRTKGRGFAKGGSVSSASSRADGCAQRGKTRGTMV